MTPEEIGIPVLVARRAVSLRAFAWALASLTTSGLFCSACKSSHKEAAADGAATPVILTPPTYDELSGSTCRASSKPTSQQGNGIAVTQVFSALGNTAPVALLQAPGDTQSWFLVDLLGGVSKFPNIDGVQNSQRTTVLDLSSTIYAENEAGLLGFAFDPDYAQNRRAYACYTVGSADNITLQVVRVTAGADGVFSSTPEVVLSVAAPNNFHLGGNIAFGPDGMLFVGLGFGGTANDAEGRAQDLSDLHGKMLRIDVRDASGSAGLAYAIPSDNPFVDNANARGEVYARGFRNPWRWSFDSTTGVLWAGDVGADQREEVDIVKPGGNYGWPVREGDICNAAAGVTPCSVPEQQEPVFAYPHGEGSCVTGGYVYRGRLIPALQGKYIFSDCLSGKIMSLTQQPDSSPQVEVIGSLPTGGVTSMAQANDGELLLLSRDSLIYRIDPVSAGGADALPQLLSKTGCVQATDPTKPVEKMLPYEVAVAFWSDRATKERWMSLPSQGRLKVTKDGAIDAPNGTVFMKRFTRNNSTIETRLLMRYDDGSWGGFSYAWDDAARDGTLVPAIGATRDLGDKTVWKYPARSSCLTCHSAAAGYTLGMQVPQINHVVATSSVFPPGNQLAAMAAAGLFDAALEKDPSSLTSFVDVTREDIDLTTRARTYLHVNCSSCHRPGGLGLGGMDFRFDTPASALGVCNQLPTYGSFGIAGAKIMAVGSPATSIMSVRMKAMDGSRMPAISSDVVDADGVHLIDRWISQQTSCP